MAWLWVGLSIVGVIVGANLLWGNSTLRVIPAGAALPVEIEAVTAGTDKTAVSLASITERPDSPPFLLIGSDSPLRPAKADFCLLGPHAAPPISDSTSQNALTSDTHPGHKISYHLTNADNHQLTLHATGFVASGIEGQVIPLDYCLPTTPKQARFQDDSASM